MWQPQQQEDEKKEEGEMEAAQCTWPTPRSGAGTGGTGPCERPWGEGVGLEASPGGSRL